MPDLAFARTGESPPEEAEGTLHLCSEALVHSGPQWTLCLACLGGAYSSFSWESFLQPDRPAALEPYRKKWAGKPLGLRALLLEVKCDWEFYSDTLHLPRWNNVAGICYMCKAVKDDLLDNSLEARWRTCWGIKSWWWS